MNRVLGIVYFRASPRIQNTHTKKDSFPKDALLEQVPVFTPAPIQGPELLPSLHLLHSLPKGTLDVIGTSGIIVSVEVISSLLI